MIKPIIGLTIGCNPMNFFWEKNDGKFRSKYGRWVLNGILQAGIAVDDG
jgi:hypothetical protein